MLLKSDDDNYKRTLHYIIDHLRDYDRFEIQGLLDCAANSSLEVIAKTDGIREIYDELGMIPEQFNIYPFFVDVIDHHFGIEGKHIFEVGGGIIPRLAKRIHMRQKTGSITVFDPRLGKDAQESERFFLRREMFTRNTPAHHADLLVGLMPCKGAEALLDCAREQSKDFMLWLCEGGPHGDYFDYYESDEEWIDSMISDAESIIKKNNMGKLKVLKYPDFSEYPIIYNQR